MLTVLSWSFFGVAQTMDFGDAPDPPYPTLIMNNGARHNVNPFVKLGWIIDPETDGQPTLFSDGDDFSGVDDDDGVIFSSWIVPGQTYQLNVISSIGGFFLNAWIDFNADGNWTTPGDQICSNVLLNAGNNLITFPVPANASVNVYTYARFRASLALNLTEQGFAPEGEVEDYRVYLGVPDLGNSIVTIDPSGSSCQNEISMTLVPIHQTIVAAYNDNPFPGGFGLGVAVSQNDGQSWMTSNLPYSINPFSGIPFIDAFDPSVTADNYGDVYVAYIATDYNWSGGPVSGLYVVKSADGGLSWSAPLAISVDNTASGLGDVTYRFNDRCQIRCDRHTGSAFQYAIYASWIKDRGWYVSQPYSDVYFSRSTDGGVTFSTPVIVNDSASNMANMPILDVASDGTLYYLWVDYHVQTGGIGKLYLDKSFDGGQTWGNDVLIDSVLLPPVNLNVPNYDVRAKGAAVLRTHPANSNMIFITYAKQPNSSGIDEADIFFIRSVDGGVTWSQPIRVNDDLTTNDQILPWMELKSDGTIDIVWYDRRNCPSDLMWDVYFASSTDGGQTFSTNAKVNALSFQSPRTTKGIWFGEYPGLATNDVNTYVAFTSSALDPMGDIFFSKIYNPVSSMTDFNAEVHVVVYPNPCNERFQVVLTETIAFNELIVELYSLSGKKEMQMRFLNTNQFVVDMTGIDRGMYFLKIFYGNNVKVEKIVKL